ncbi:putative membrane protein YccC [Paraburkholderia bannensis]|uniref:Putative membrane protein YccC n=1 Tax=Paraburkholderia bannensis TaxID=765414 RepID=A0A7W9WWK1_9BURK|nr:MULTISPECIES: FUSC family protein [Paraburkholderia]MBB3261649.1 putative membrane protein YccC [Paraburkholderia sp. WP4_3_2]MBB6106646.1 putative membrane protein YccC [Paraburkholderia bannensis]
MAVKSPGYRAVGVDAQLLYLRKPFNVIVFSGRTHPDALFIASLTRAAEVTIGILSSAAVSALVFPVRASTALMHGQRQRRSAILDLCADVLAGRCEHAAFQQRFARLAGSIAGFEAARTFASYEDPNLRMRSQRLARIDSEYAALCSRLHILGQQIERLDNTGAGALIAELRLSLQQAAGLVERLRDNPPETPDQQSTTALARLAASLTRGAQEAAPGSSLQPSASSIEAHTLREALRRLLESVLDFLAAGAVVAGGAVGTAQSQSPRVPAPPTRTSSYVVALTLVRNALTVGATGAFWLLTAWPSGGMAVIAAAIAAGLSSAAPRPEKLAMQIALGAAAAVALGYVYLGFVYPAITGFPLLCVVLAPIVAGSAFLASRPSTSGYGIGLCVFFVVLAGPDNMMAYAPDVFLNNGLAAVVALLIAVITATIVFPLQTPWVVTCIQRDLRREVAFAWETRLDGADARFRSRTHDLSSQLRVLLAPGSPRYDQAWHRLLATLELGQALLDLRGDIATLVPKGTSDRPRWLPGVEQGGRRVADLFERPDAPLAALAVCAANRALERVAEEAQKSGRGARQAALLKLSGDLCLMRSALLDPDAPFHCQTGNSA